MGNTYDVWWKKGEETDDDMARDHQESWQRIIQMLDPVHIKGQTILDFGCNQGGFLRQLYQTHEFDKGVGIDLAYNSLEKANTLKEQRPLEYYLTGKPQTTGYKFDTAISTSVLYLIEDVPQHARDLKAVLKEKGVYYATFADHTNNPSRYFMKETIDKYGATPSQDHSLKHIVDSFVAEGFEVAVIKESVPDVINLTNYSDFYLSPNDYLRTLFEESFLIKATLKEGTK